jgi:hypothetical protein
MHRRSVLPSLRPFLAAIAAAILSATVSPAARASQAACFVEVPGTPKKAPAPRPRPVTRPRPASSVGAAQPARPAFAAARPARRAMPAAKAEAASMRKVPVECAPKVMDDVRVRSAVLEEDAPQASAAVPRRSGFAGTGSLPAAGAST